MSAQDVVRAAAKAIWLIRREEEDMCDRELDDLPATHPVWDEARAACAAIQSFLPSHYWWGLVHARQLAENYRDHPQLPGDWRPAWEAMVDKLAVLVDERRPTTDVQAKQLPPPVCTNCDGSGMIGYTSGQTAEQFEQGAYPCPECAQVVDVFTEQDGLPKLPEAFEAEFATPGASPVSVYTAAQMKGYARAALAARQPGAQVPVAEVSGETFNDDGTSDIIKPALAIGTKLYAAPPAPGIDLAAIRTLVAAVELEFCGEGTEANEPDDSKVSYPEEACPITFGMIRAARRAIGGQRAVAQEVSGG